MFDDALVTMFAIIVIFFAGLFFGVKIGKDMVWQKVGPQLVCGEPSAGS